MFDSYPYGIGECKIFYRMLTIWQCGVHRFLLHQQFRKFFINICILNNLLYNILVYTFGLSILKKATTQQGVFEAPENSENILHKIVNAGTISAVLTIVFYLGDFNVPVIISSSLSYAGRATTLLSMLVLGVSVAQMAPKDIFSHPKLYIFIIIRQILIPIVFTLSLGLFIKNPLILNTCALMLASGAICRSCFPSS